MFFEHLQISEVRHDLFIIKIASYVPQLGSSLEDKAC